MISKSEAKSVDDALQKTERAAIRSGVGVRRAVRSRSTTISMLGRIFGWDHPFAVHYYGIKSLIAPGTVNGQYPTIKGKSIKVDDKGQYPLLDMQDFKGAASWVCAEITRSGKGTDPQDKTKPLIKTIEIVHVQNLNDQEISAYFGGALGYPDVGDNKTRLPLARIETQQFGPATFQIASFNYSYTIKIANGKTRNYFYPA